METPKQKFRFHVVALPHTATNKDYLLCAFTQKVLNFCKMMKSLGHEVYHYGGEGSIVEATEHITIITQAERDGWWGENNWKQDFFAVDFDTRKPYWELFNQRSIEEIGKRIQAQDFICVIGGYCHKPIAEAFPNNMTVEFGIGYEGSFAKYRVFESYAWMHHTYGKEGINDGRAFDAVIPNYFDIDDFPWQGEPDDYFAFVGRMIQRKGADLAVDATREIGAKLKMAGQGIKKAEGGKLIGSEVEFEGEHLEYVGTVDVHQRAELMGKAKALFVPTRYIEPFGGVAIEAMLVGCPVIATDWGAFTETVQHGVNGYRVRTLGEAMEACRLVEKLDRRKIRNEAIKTYSIDVVKWRYQAYFEQLMELWGEGWYTKKASDLFAIRHTPAL